MGFLQGIIADARPAASDAVTDANRPVITGRGERINSPLSGGVASGEAGMQKSDFSQPFGSGLADPGRGLSPVDRQPSAVSAPDVDTTHSFRHDSITAKSRTSAVSGHDDRSRAALSVNVEYHGAGQQESDPAEAVINPEAEISARDTEPSANHREPSVFSVMPTEVHDAFQNDNLPPDTSLLSGHERSYINNAAHEDITSESLSSLSHAGGLDNPDTDDNASPVYQQRPPESGAVHQEASRPLADKRTITPGHSDHPPAPEKNEQPGTHAGFVDAASVPLTGPDSMQGETFAGPASAEKLHQSLPADREAKQPDTPASSDDLSQPIPAQEMTRPSSNNTKPSLPSRRSISPHENKQTSFDTNTEVSAVQRSMAQSPPPKGEADNSKRDTPSAEVNRLQRQEVITANSKLAAFQKERPVSRHVRQQPAGKPGSSFIPPSPVQKAPEVKIGQVDVFIEAPRKEASPAKRTHKVSQAFSSRHYLRRV